MLMEPSAQESRPEEDKERSRKGEGGEKQSRIMSTVEAGVKSKGWAQVFQEQTRNYNIYQE